MTLVSEIYNKYPHHFDVHEDDAVELVNEILERAAQECERLVESWDAGPASTAADTCAEYIRALKSESVK